MSHRISHHNMGRGRFSGKIISNRYAYKMVLIYILFLSLAFHVKAQITDDIPIRPLKLSDRVLFIKTGKTSVMPNVIVIASQEGLVMIDSHMSPYTAARIRKIVEQHFGRKDFKYLINTHGANDHTGGNQVFSDANIIGHDNCITEMNGLMKFIQNPPPGADKMMDERISRIRDMLKEAKKDSDEKMRLQESLYYFQDTLENLKSSDFILSPPKITFNDSITIHLEELTLELNFSIIGYSTSDIIIHVPEEKLLIVGDVFNKDRIPIIRENTDIPRWMNLFKKYINNEIEIKNVIGGHGDIMTIGDVCEQLDYIKDLWEGIAASKKEGSTIEEVKETFSFDTKFGHLSHLRHKFSGVPIDFHERNVESVWKMVGE